jgi:hypothetical protein
VLSDEELRELVERELREDIERRLRDGASRDAVVASLIDEGFIPETARAYVDAVTGPDGPDRRRHRTLLSAFVMCLVLVVVVLLVLVIRA